LKRAVVEIVLFALAVVFLVGTVVPHKHFPPLSLFLLWQKLVWRVGAGTDKRDGLVPQFDGGVAK
jgi:hypothetical protein